MDPNFQENIIKSKDNSMDDLTNSGNIPGEIPAEDVSNKDETAGNMNISVVGAADSLKKVEPSFSAEGCEAESNMDVLTDAVAAVESRNISSDIPDGVQLPSETVAKADVVTEDQPRSPIHGVSLLHGDSIKLKGKTPTKRSRKVGKSSPLLTPPATGNVTPVSNTRPGGVTPIPTSTLTDLNNLTSISHHSFTDYQQVQLRAQILVYGSLLSGMPPEESHMVSAFGQSDGERAWEATWHAFQEKVRGQKSQPNNPGLSTPDQGIKIGSAQSKVFSVMSIPILNPMIPISSPLWNIPTPFLSGIPPLHPYQTPGNIAGNNPLWPSQGPFIGQRFASSPIASFNARLPTLPITEPVKLTTVKESGSSSIPVILQPGQPSSDPESRQRKKVVQPVSVDQNIEKIVTREETMSKIEESKVQAADAAVHAAAAVSHCENVWSQLESQKNSGLVSDDEAKLASSAVSVAAASFVAKVAAAAAKIASNVAEQASLMADEVLLSSRKESYDQSGTTSLLSAAKKHAENLDAIVKAAELAAEAVSQNDKIVAICNPLSLRELVEAGPEGYWKNPLLSNQQKYSEKQNIEIVPDNKDDSGDSSKNKMIIIDGISGSVTSCENDKSTESGHASSNLSKTVGLMSESEFGLVPSFDVDKNIPQSASGTWKDSIIEGCLVEVLKDINKKRAWFAANVLTLKDGKAFVYYTEIQSDEGTGKLKEWVPLEVEGTETPRLRVAHPMTTLRSEGTRKRNRTAFTDYAWSSGDLVDVWVQDRWCEAVVVDTNKNDATSLTVQFPVQGETSVVRSWHVRSTLIWKDGKWIEWSNLNGSHSLEGDTRNEKRQKFDTPVVEGKEKAKSSNSVNCEKSGVQNKSLRSGLQREQSRVVFGVLKPEKQQKLMDVSTHCVADRHVGSNVPNDSVKLVNKLMPQAPGRRGSKNSYKNDAKEKQVLDVKSKAIKIRKPPVPSFRSLTQKDKLRPSKPTSPDAFSSDENLPGQTNMMDFESSSAEVAKKISKSKTVGKTAAGDGNATKVEVKDNKSTSEAEPRRSVRRIQPTSRLLDGLQSSLTFSKLHTASHASPRSQKKFSSKGSTNLI